MMGLALSAASVVLLLSFDFGLLDIFLISPVLKYPLLSVMIDAETWVVVVRTSGAVDCWQARLRPACLAQYHYPECSQRPGNLRRDLLEIMLRKKYSAHT